MSSSLKARLALACTSLFLTAACGGGEKAPPAAAPSSTAPAVTAPGGGAPLPVAEGDFGVPECDSYIKKYLACIDSKVPEATRSMFRQGLDQSKASWKQAASTPEEGPAWPPPAPRPKPPRSSPRPPTGASGSLTPSAAPAGDSPRAAPPIDIAVFIE